jgi:hypothetical protein
MQYSKGWVYCNIKHDFIFISIDIESIEWEKTYVCKKCGIIGLEWEDLPGKISVEFDFINLTCEEYLIKNIIE